MSALEDEFAFQLRAAKLPKPERQFRFAPPRKWKFDFCWPEYKLAAEINGGTWIQGRHNRGSSVNAEYEKLNSAVFMRWFVLLFTADQVKDGTALQAVERCIDVAISEIIKRAGN